MELWQQSTEDARFTKEGLGEVSLSIQVIAIEGRDGRTCWEVSHPFGVARQIVTWWPRRVQIRAPSTVLFLKNSRALAKVSIRLGIVRAGAPWSKRYPSRSAYIFFKDTMAGSGGISKVGAIPVVLP